MYHYQCYKINKLDPPPTPPFHTNGFIYKGLVAHHCSRMWNSNPLFMLWKRLWIQRHCDPFQCQGHIQYQVAHLWLGAQNQNNEHRIIEEITVSISYWEADCCLWYHTLRCVQPTLPHPLYPSSPEIQHYPHCPSFSLCLSFHPSYISFFYYETKSQAA